MEITVTKTLVVLMIVIQSVWAGAQALHLAAEWRLYQMDAVAASALYPWDYKYDLILGTGNILRGNLDQAIRHAIDDNGCDVISISLGDPCLPVSEVTRALDPAYARKLGGDEEKWGTVGLIHDFDYEQNPDPEHHPEVGARILEARGSPITTNTFLSVFKKHFI